jgi:mannose-6-phosphate isomerase-like protein (cupin superfamily)
MAHFELPPGRTSRAVLHRTVEEIWYFLGGQGQFWRKLGDQEEIAAVQAGTCITIPIGTHFQFRSLGPGPLSAVAITMPSWPGEAEAQYIPGKWPESE